MEGNTQKKKNKAGVDTGFVSEMLNKTNNPVSKMSNNAGKMEQKHSEDNVFYILGVQDFEIRHSNFLKWLMEKDKYFLQEFLQRACGFSQEEAKKLTGYKYEVKREYSISKEEDVGVKSGRIDILLKFEDKKTVVVIENKFHSGEGEKQLSGYYKGISNSKDFEGYEKKFIFLTPKGEEPKEDEDKKNYISASYDLVREILEKMNTSENVEKILINHYKEVLREELMKNEKEIDKIEEYYKLFGGKKGQIMSDIAKYVPNIKKRAEIEREIVKKIDGLELKSEGQNTFVSITQKELSSVSLKNGLGKDWLSFCISNEPFNVMSMQFVIEYDKGEKYKKFAKEFREKFDRTDNHKGGDYEHLLTETLVVSNKTSGYLTEEEIQEKIKEELVKFFTDPNSKYFQILDFVRNYKF